MNMRDFGRGAFWMCDDCVVPHSFMTVTERDCESV